MLELLSVNKGLHHLRHLYQLLFGSVLSSQHNPLMNDLAYRFFFLGGNREECMQGSLAINKAY